MRLERFDGTYGIGQFATLSGLTIKALRYYDRLGLLRPAGVHPKTRYRRYTAVQIADANRIIALRDAGALLAEVVERDGAVLERIRERIVNRMRADRRLLSHVDALLAAKLPSIAVKHQPPIRVAFARRSLKHYDDVDALFEQILEAVPRASWGPIYGALWSNCGPEFVDCAAFVGLVKPIRNVRAPVECGVLPSAQVASLLIDGKEPKAFEAGYAALHSWMADNECTLTGPKAEWYVAPLGSGSNTLTELRFPFRQGAAAIGEKAPLRRSRVFR